jgi:hypothetical protein
MRTRILSFMLAVASGWTGSLRAEEAGAPAETPAPAPLLVAAGDRPSIEFQIGADVMGGYGATGAGLGDNDLVAGVNAAFLYTALPWLWVGVRPSLHYVLPERGEYDVTWMHADAALCFNVLQAPVRLYALLAGGYAFATDTDLYDGLAHGGSGLLAFGVAWRSEDIWGVFAEVGFRYGRASAEKTRYRLDEAGERILDPVSLTYEREFYTRAHELYALTFNLGITVSP